MEAKNELVVAVRNAKKEFTEREILKIVLEEIGISKIQISEEELLVKITEVMSEFGMPVYLAGSSYIKEGIRFAIKQEKFPCLLKDIKKHIANKYYLAEASIGKIMHDSIERIGQNSEKTQEKYLGYICEKKITVCEFVMGIAQYFRMNYDVIWLQEGSQV